MVEVAGNDTFFTNIVPAATFTRTQWEGCIEQAIDEINGYARDDIIPQMTGTAGSKTVSLTSMQAGFVRKLAALIYTSTAKTAGAQSESFGAGGLSHSQSASASNVADVENLAREAATSLREIEVSYG